MGNRDKNLSTVIVTSKNHSQTHSFVIKTQYFKYWKTYFGGVIIVMCLLVAIVVSLSFYVQSQDIKTKNLERQVAQLKSKSQTLVNNSISQVQIALPKKISDTTDVQTFINQIQNKLKKVNEYLHKRGVRGFSNISMGGNNKKNTPFATNEKLELYNEYLTRLLNGLKSIPLGYPHIGGTSSVFGYRADPFEASSGEFHAGIDLRGTKGEKVKSTASGKVIWANWFQGYGNCVRIAHTSGYQTLYGHLSEIKVKNGQLVHAGDIIGYIGSTGHSTGPHLHYEVRLNNKPINPKNFLSL